MFKANDLLKTLRLIKEQITFYFLASKLLALVSLVFSGWRFKKRVVSLFYQLGINDTDSSWV